MAEGFHHGIAVQEIDNEGRPVEVVRSAVVGAIGTAPGADPEKFPLNTPVLCTREDDFAGLGTTGTLIDAADGVYDQAKAVSVFIRTDAGANDAEAQSNVIGGVDNATGQYQGLKALLAAESIIGVKPKILIAPGFSHVQSVATEMISTAERLRAVVFGDGPNTNDADAIAYAGLFGSDRFYLTDPWARKWDTVTSSEINAPMSSRIAGLQVKVDNDIGFWGSVSNKPINGILGTTRPVEFELDDPTCRANILNEKRVNTVVLKNGHRCWGNRSVTADQKWTFLNVRRTADMIHESIILSHLWAVDKNITATYVDSVLASVNGFIRDLVAKGAILGGECWADPELFTPQNIAQGKVYFDFKFTPSYVAESITFRSHLTHEYINTLLAA